MVKLEDELSALVEQLRPGGPQAVCEALRARIAAVREAIQHRERNIQFVTDAFMDGE
jgi:hypothetical protein